jgi:hypothetical protein
VAYQFLLHRLALTRFQVGRNHYQDAPFEEIRNRLAPIADELAELGTQLKDDRVQEQVFGLANVTWGFINYFLEDYQQGADYLDQACRAGNDPDHQLWLMRPLVVSLARLGEETAFRRIELRAKHIIDEGASRRPEVVCTFYEGLGRGQAALRSNKTFETFARGLDEYRNLAQTAKAPFHHVQLARSILEAMKLFELRDGSLERFIEGGVTCAREYGYPRHVLMLERKLPI